MAAAPPSAGAAQQQAQQQQQVNLDEAWGVFRQGVTSVFKQVGV